MKRTLYLKFILAYLLFGLFGFIVVATFITSMIGENVRSRHASSLYTEATVLANSYAADLFSTEISRSAVERELNAVAAYIGAKIRIIDPSGRIVISSGSIPGIPASAAGSGSVNGASGAADGAARLEGFDPSAFTVNYYTEDSFFNSFSEDHINVLAPIAGDYRILGYVSVHLPSSAVTAEINSLVNISYLTLLVLLLLSLIILIFFTEIVYVPLRKITKATEQYAAGNMHYTFSVESEDEIGYLGATLGYMADQIARSEDDQKKFIANVSHDFRSPLTSIRGFLEAMIDGTIPPEQHEKYLTRVLQETQRLTKLTSSLLMLNNLNTSGMYLNKTDFDINGVIRSVAASFEPIGRDRGVSMRLLLLGEELFVNADLEKIQQVLYNLVDNAMKFTPQGGLVTIETSEQHNKVFVSVRDNGVGIPNEDQKLVWDRFYKSDSSRGKDKKGTGLGLSIVREIIRAHEENINLISTEGVGTEFIFTLKRSEINDELYD